MSTLVAINNYFYERGGSEAIFFAHNRMLEDLGWNDMGFEPPKAAEAPRDETHDAFGDDVKHARHGFSTR